jgi:hypothetical protein
MLLVENREHFDFAQCMSRIGNQELTSGKLIDAIVVKNRICGLNYANRRRFYSIPEMRSLTGSLISAINVCNLTQLDFRTPLAPALLHEPKKSYLAAPPYRCQSCQQLGLREGVPSFNFPGQFWLVDPKG